MILNNARHYKKQWSINGLILALAFYGMSQRKMEAQEVSLFDRFLIDTLAPIQKWARVSYLSVHDFFRDHAVNVSIGRQNQGLRQEISALKQRLFEMEEVARENRRLKELLAFGGQPRAQKILAQVVSWDANGHLKVIRLNKGSAHGVRLQSVAVTSDGLVGYVFRMTKHFSDVLTTLDSSNRVDGIVARTRSHGIVEGDSYDRYVMKFVTRTEPVKMHDIVITSGLGNIYPKGIKIGVISKIERESYGITQYIEILPSVDFSKLEEVILFTYEDDKKRKDEWDALDDVEVN